MSQRTDLCSIKRDIGHLCRDELKPATGKQAPPSIDTTSSSAVTGPSYASQVSVPQTMPLRTCSGLAADQERFDSCWPWFSFFSFPSAFKYYKSNTCLLLSDEQYPARRTTSNQPAMAQHAAFTATCPAAAAAASLGV
jgi:hypothetical protein